jgi:hypothetical protein
MSRFDGDRPRKLSVGFQGLMGEAFFAWLAKKSPVVCHAMADIMMTSSTSPNSATMIAKNDAR